MDKWPDTDQFTVYEPPRPPQPPMSALQRQAEIVERRLAKGLPVSADIVAEVLAATGPEGRDGVYTDAEEADTYGGNERWDRAMAVLANAEHVLAGMQLSWIDGRQVVHVRLTGELDRYRELLIDALGAERVIVSQAQYTAKELDQFHQRVRSDSSELTEHGIYITQSGTTRDGIKLAYYAADLEFADRLLHDRYGATADIQYLGASRYAIKPHPFGSWHASEKQLHLFYALPHNSEQPASATVLEREESVIVSLNIFGSRLPRRLGHRPDPTHLTVDLAAPLGTRTVIDNSVNRARPHWTEVPQGLRHPFR